MSRPESRFSLILVLGVVYAGCTDAPEAPDAVMSELPGAETTFRTYQSPLIGNPTIKITGPVTDEMIFVNNDGIDPAGICDFTTANEVCSPEKDQPCGITFEVSGYESLAEFGLNKVCLFRTGTLISCLTKESMTATGESPNFVLSGTFDLSVPFGEHLATVVIQDANDKDLAFASARNSIAILCSKTCLGDFIECKDDFVCNFEGCYQDNVELAPGSKICKFGIAVNAADCCETKYQCNFGSLCNVGTNKCVACLENTDCNDGNSCTTDTCTLGKCSNVKEDPFCCDCNTPNFDEKVACNDGLFCSIDICNCDTKQCDNSGVTSVGTKLGVPLTCCEKDDHAYCATQDLEPCNIDFCVVNTCHTAPFITPQPNCCNEDSDCNDGLACTTDTCDLAANNCVNTPVADPNCCNGTVDCDDGKPNTINSCVDFSCVFTEDPFYCEYDTQSVIVINEIMKDPDSVSDNAGEWIELYNSGATPVDLKNWKLSSVGDNPLKVTLGADGTDVTIAAKGYLVLCRNGDTAVNGGVTCDYAYGTTYTLGNGVDSVVLEEDGGVVHDTVAYDDGVNFPDVTGSSLELKSELHDNAVGASWAASTAALGDLGDFGTPGAANSKATTFEVAKCNDNNICTFDTCVPAGKLANGKTYGSCQSGHIAIDQCCTDASQCTGPTKCHTAICNTETDRCEYTLTPPPACCTTDAVCDDGKSCNLDLCVGFTCKHAPPIYIDPLCCDSDEDCGKVDNKCIIAECNTDLNKCKPPEFSADPDCCQDATGVDGIANDGDSGGLTDPECADALGNDPSKVYPCKNFLCQELNNTQYCNDTVNYCNDGNVCTAASTRHSATSATSARTTAATPTSTSAPSSSRRTAAPRTPWPPTASRRRPTRAPSSSASRSRPAARASAEA